VKLAGKVSLRGKVNPDAVRGATSEAKFQTPEGNADPQTRRTVSALWASHLESDSADSKRAADPAIP
jgi:hypothetical protein